MSPLPLLDQIIQLLTQYYHDNKPATEIILDELPALADSLLPRLKHYVAKYDSLPDSKLLWSIANNFYLDGPLVEALSDLDPSPDAVKALDELRDNLVKLAHKKWPEISTFYREKIISQTLERVWKGLPKFLFMSRLSTWIFTILRNEYLRLQKKIQEEQARETHLEQKDVIEFMANRPSPGPSKTLECKQVVDELWQRIDELEGELAVRILRWRQADCTLEEIKQKLGKDAPSIATLSRWIKRWLNRLKEDEQFKEIARRLGRDVDDEL